MKARDLVCRMEVAVKSAQNKLEYKGKTYSFCTAYCLFTFLSEPEKYLEGSKPTST
ncbi:MAG: YHS domain-containing protein [Bacteroidota bacterium]